MANPWASAVVTFVHTNLGSLEVRELGLHVTSANTFPSLSQVSLEETRKYFGSCNRHPKGLGVCGDRKCHMCAHLLRASLPLDLVPISALSFLTL